MAKEINIKFVFEENKERFEPLSVEYETGDNHAMLAYCLAYVAATESVKKSCFLGHFENDLKLLLLENVLEKLNGDN